MSGHTPEDPVIARSEQLRLRLAGMKELVQGFASHLMDEIQTLEDEVGAHADPGAKEGRGDDGPGASGAAPGARP